MDLSIFFIYFVILWLLCAYWLSVWYKSYAEDQDELELMYYNDRTVFDYLDIHVDKNTTGKNNRYD